MAATTTQSTAELLGEMIELTLDHRCPICGDKLHVMGCVLGPRVLVCATRNKMLDNDPRLPALQYRENTINALKLLLSSSR
jgi:hypothetical protein